MFICLKCCGVHRSLGTHISKVTALGIPLPLLSVRKKEFLTGTYDMLFIGHGDMNDCGLLVFDSWLACCLLCTETCMTLTCYYWNYVSVGIGQEVSKRRPLVFCYKVFLFLWIVFCSILIKCIWDQSQMELKGSDLYISLWRQIWLFRRHVFIHTGTVKMVLLKFWSKWMLEYMKMRSLCPCNVAFFDLLYFKVLKL